MLKTQNSTRKGFNTSIDEIRQFTLPQLRENKLYWYIEFYSYDPLFKKLRRKRIRVNRVRNIRERRKYARTLIDRFTQKLISGWNPWISTETGSVMFFSEMCEKYSQYNEKMHYDGHYRDLTFKNHYYHMKKLIDYNSNHRIVPITYLYQFDLRFCNDFLDYIYIELKLSGIYRNSCLTFLKLIGNWCIEKGFLENNPAMLISPIPKKLLQKRRLLIPSDTVAKISKYLKENDRFFLISCYLLYYCYIRPIEQTRLKLEYFSLKNGTLTIPASDSKNRLTQTITIPKVVWELMLDLQIFNSKYKMDMYLFSINLEPGYKQISTRWLTEHWQKLKKRLSLNKDYTFYSLKDTGITEALREGITDISVRDQARHSSLAITDIYARHNDKADENYIDYKGSL